MLNKRVIQWILIQPSFRFGSRISVIVLNPSTKQLLQHITPYCTPLSSSYAGFVVLWGPCPLTCLCLCFICFLRWITISLSPTSRTLFVLAICPHAIFSQKPFLPCHLALHSQCLLYHPYSLLLGSLPHFLMTCPSPETVISLSFSPLSLELYTGLPLLIFHELGHMTVLGLRWHTSRGYTKEGLIFPNPLRNRERCLQCRTV